MVIQEPVQAAVWQALNHYAYKDAAFLAERLYAEVHTDDTRFLLANCYYRSGKVIKAKLLLEGSPCKTAQSRYLLAKCCLELDKPSQAEETLSGINVLAEKTRSSEYYVTEYGESASYVLQLLATVYSRTERHKKACEFFNKSLALNPFLWSSFESLCDAGETPDPSLVFQVQMATCQPTPCQPGPPSHNQPTRTCRAIINVDNTQDPPRLAVVQENTPLAQTLLNHSPADPVAPSTIEMSSDTLNYSSPEPTGLNIIPPSAPKTTRRPRGGRSLLGGTASLSPLTPSFGVLPLDTPSPGVEPLKATPQYITPSPMTLGENQPEMRAPPKNTRLSSRVHHVKPPVFNQSGNTSSLQTGSQNVPRRSSRLFSHANSVKENNNTNRGKTNGPKAAPAKKYRTKRSQEIGDLSKGALEPDSKPTLQGAQTLGVTETWQRQSAAGLMSLFRDLGRAYQALAHYDCKKAVELFTSLPVHHYQTGWVLAQLGKAYFEMAEYQKAANVFSEIRRIAPYHFGGMELYSTTLWHLQKDVTLSTLAQELTELDQNSPEAWCATGNCFSQQKEHDSAIQFFQRAVQVDRAFPYAYTLLGHEYVLVEEFDKAMACFRNAVHVDSRHYNAWYGIGMIFYRQEKFGLAEIHFRKALSINSQSTALMCHVGMVQHALKKSDSALSLLNKAITANPKNPLCKFHRASILLAVARHREALQELEELKQIVPKESLVYFLMGKVHKKMGNAHLALLNFSWAMDLDPKGANNHIKETIFKRYDVTDEEEDTMSDVRMLHGADETPGGTAVRVQPDGLPMPDLPAEVPEMQASISTDDSF